MWNVIFFPARLFRRKVENSMLTVDAVIVACLTLPVGYILSSYKNSCLVIWKRWVCADAMKHTT